MKTRFFLLICAFASCFSLNIEAQQAISLESMQQPGNDMPKKVAAATVVPRYFRPQGTYLFGLGVAGYSRGFFVPAYTPLTFRNLTTGASETAAYNWYGRFIGEDNTYIDSEAKTPEAVSFPFSTAETPTLSVTDGRVFEQYIYGPTEQATEKFGVIQAGGWAEAGNMDRVSDGYSTYYFSSADKKDFCFGTSKSRKVDAIGNFFEKPAAPLLVRSVAIAIGALIIDNAKVTDNDMLTLRAIRVTSEGKLADTLATKSVHINSILDLTGTSHHCFYLSFQFDNPLKVRDAVFYELSGFYGNPSYEFGVQTNHFSGLESNAYVYEWQGEAGSEKRVFLNANEYTRNAQNPNGMNFSLFYSLDAQFPVVHAELPEVICQTTAGNAEITFETSYNPANTSMPLDFQLNSNWARITSIDRGEGDHNVCVIKISYDNLPSGTAGRTANLEAKAYGLDDQIIPVKQGTVSGINQQTISPVNAIYTGEDFEVTYGAGYNRLEVFGINGHKVVEIQLSGTGKDLIPSHSWNPGMYFFRFNGKNNPSTVKTIKK